VSEYQIQCQIVALLRANGFLVYSTPNELLGSLKKKIGYGRMQRAVRSGLLSGVADLTVVLPNRIVFLEVKTNTGKQSENQKIFERKVKALGHEYYVVRNAEESLTAVS